MECFSARPTGELQPAKKGCVACSHAANVRGGRGRGLHQREAQLDRAPPGAALIRRVRRIYLVGKLWIWRRLCVKGDYARKESILPNAFV